ncbi:hypothetical protein B0H15DRAFT_957259 [Mycena belliarum]|uniref:Uncharacterized protein n=1 Tax=Mycena belliarum TaxID=1033014 RepID=A0AAD6XLP9_9AGAR|nr:hypothetical protein B0H15DRAFT_957259 [Mycena belliae]
MQRTTRSAGKVPDIRDSPPKIPSRAKKRKVLPENDVDEVASVEVPVAPAAPKARPRPRPVLKRSIRNANTSNIRQGSPSAPSAARPDASTAAPRGSRRSRSPATRKEDEGGGDLDTSSTSLKPRSRSPARPDASTAAPRESRRSRSPATRKKDEGGLELDMPTNSRKPRSRSPAPPDVSKAAPAGPPWVRSRSPATRKEADADLERADEEADLQIADDDEEELMDTENLFLYHSSSPHPMADVLPSSTYTSPSAIGRRRATDHSPSPPATLPRLRSSRARGRSTTPRSWNVVAGSEHSAARSDEELLKTPRLPPVKTKKSLRPSSPPIASNSSESGDDYEQQQDLLNRQQQRLVDCGYKRPQGVEDDDEEEFEELLKQVEEEGMGEEEAPSQKKQKAKKKATSKPRKKTTKSYDANEGQGDSAAAAPRKGRKGKGKGKGKEKARVADVEAEQADNEDEDGSESEGGGHQAGPVPDDIKEEVIAAYDAYLEKVAELAAKCNKSPHTLHQVVGHIVKTCRGSTPWNMWQKWYATTNEKPPENTLSTKDFTNESRAAFKKACGLPDEQLRDKEAVYAKIPWLREWNEELMMKAVTLNTIRIIYETFGVHVWGYVIDPQGEASYMFGATGAFVDMRKNEPANMGQVIKDCEHIFGMYEIKKRGGPVLGPSLNLLPADFEQKDGEKLRDAGRRTFSRIMAAQTSVACGKASNNMMRMQWGPKFLDLAFEHQFKIVNYPPTLEDLHLMIGEAFDMRKIGTAQFQEFLPAMEKVNCLQTTRKNADDDDVDADDAMAIVSWDDNDKAWALEDQRDVVLIAAVDGRSLRSVKDSEAYSSALVKERMKTKASRKKSKAKRQRSSSQSRSRSRSRSRSPSRRPLPLPRSLSHSRNLPRSPSRSREEKRYYAPYPDYGSYPPYPQYSEHQRRSPPPQAGPSRHHDEYLPPPPRSVAPPPPPADYGHYHTPVYPPTNSRNDAWSYERPVAPLPRHHDAAPPAFARGRTARQESRPRPASPPARAELARLPPIQENAPRQEGRGTGTSRGTTKARGTSARPQHGRSPEPEARASASASRHETGSVDRPAKRQRTEGRPLESGELKRKREDESTATPDEPHRLISCRFNYPNAEIWSATSFKQVKTQTRADRRTLALYKGKWDLIGSGYTPVFATSVDERRYKSEIELHSLHEPPR